jgi:hypothetical protein
MNCPKCNASIDYHFSTTCEQCQAELPCLTSPTESVEISSPANVPKRSLSITECVRKAFLVLVTSVMGTVVGTISMYALAHVYYRIFVFDPVAPPSCGDGMAVVAILFTLAGAYLGCAGGSIIGYKFRLSPDPLAE